jgi:LmbE family N-acetylglucosaminyl deacetylase
MTGTDRFTHIYLSPHLDDVVLSCGGRIWQQGRAGDRVMVVTVFSGAPDPGAQLSAFARALHARWGEPSEAVKMRQEEDLRALSLLGAESLHWPYPDCIYRTTSGGEFAYASFESLWGQIHLAEATLVRELAARITALPLSPEGILCAPLTVGRHVDHRIVRQAAESAGRPLVYYEDYPYAEDQSAVETTVAGSQWGSELVSLSQDALNGKIAAVACYRSQISTFWVDLEDMAAALRTFAERTGRGCPAERYWRPNLP